MTNLQKPEIEVTKTSNSFIFAAHSTKNDQGRITTGINPPQLCDFKTLILRRNRGICASDIPKGCREMCSKPEATDEWIAVSKRELAELPAYIQFLIGNYCLYDEENYEELQIDYSEIVDRQV